MHIEFKQWLEEQQYSRYMHQPSGDNWYINKRNNEFFCTFIIWSWREMIDVCYSLKYES
jgi:hypothetical protein